MAAKSPGVWGTQDWLDSTNVGYGSIPVSTSIWASFHCPIYFHLCSYIFPKLILPYFAYTQFWGWEFCGTHGFEVWELDDVFQVFYWLLNRKWQLCSDVFITKILTFENGWIFENICPYFQRLARQGILESAVAGAALWTPGSFWAEPGHIVGSLLGGRPWPKWGSQRWCLMMFDGWGCTRLLLPRGDCLTYDQVIPRYMCGYTKAWNCRTSQKETTWCLLCTTYAMFRLICACFPEKQSFLSVIGVWVLIFMGKKKNSGSKLKTSRTTAVGRCFSAEPYWIINIHNPIFFLNCLSTLLDWGEGINASGVTGWLKALLGSIWLLRVRPAFGFEMFRLILPSVKLWSLTEALETFKSLVTSCSFNPLSSILQARQSFHCQAQQATVAADLLQAAMEVQHEVMAAMVLGARVTVKRFPNFFEALGLQSLIRFIWYIDLGSWCVRNCWYFWLFLMGVDFVLMIFCQQRQRQEMAGIQPGAIHPSTLWIWWTYTQWCWLVFHGYLTNSSWKLEQQKLCKVT